MLAASDDERDVQMSLGWSAVGLGRSNDSVCQYSLIGVSLKAPLM